MAMSSYFLHGMSFIDSTFWGWFELFSSTHFSGFFYMSIILSLGNYISTLFISKLYEPIIPAISACFEPSFSALLFPHTGV